MARIILFLLMIPCSMVHAQESFYNREVKAVIELEDKEGFVNITGIATNLTSADQGIRYELAVIRKDTASGNSTKNKQTGRTVLKASDKVLLSKTSVNLNIPDLITIMLLIYDVDDKLLGKEIKRIEPNTREIAVVQSTAYDGIEFKGIVLKKLRTAPARKFYDYFYEKYRFYNINGSEIVTIKEVFGQGRTSKVEVLVGRDLVFEFFLNPTEKYIEQMGDNAIYKVYNKFESLKAQEAAIKNY
ncbi:CsgE family curli-type amyloid fiber assembly protein [Nonlabens ponticola]|uniref:Curli production assembly/transport component CsgE n=1 Tax=Nonlabens ponticola TaxID=2496866 RepID=A0A3S9MXS5_9FLAO|nr:CsgE family curli-type amyloid fiber assembly protein [Nonlabens ponticola]AZQ44076.1 hypothetical protein EJ995_07470 [Nonlabens ponticola]